MNLRSNKGKYEGFRSFGVEKPPYLGDVTQVKKKTELYTADMWGTIDRELEFWNDTSVLCSGRTVNNLITNG